MFSNVLVLLILLNGNIYDALGCEQILCPLLPQASNNAFSPLVFILQFLFEVYGQDLAP